MTFITFYLSLTMESNQTQNSGKFLLETAKLFCKISMTISEMTSSVLSVDSMDSVCLKNSY
jgi:hypothetical protein